MLNGRYRDRQLLMEPFASTVQPNGWRLTIADGAALAPDVIEAALQFANSNRAPFRRSRHAITFLLRSSSGTPEADLFVKYFDPPAGWERLKSSFRPSRAFRTKRVTAALRAAGFFVPPILMHGIHCDSRRELIVTARVEGDGPILALRGLKGSIAVKRATLYALGAEVGRLHGAGFIHGDLTPFNIRIVIAQSPRFTFIDNERTRRNVIIRRGRRRLRNLVQLGHFVLPGITRADRMRVFRAYEAALYQHHSRALERRAAAMLRRRVERDLDC
jgi:Lipopolysaccharide kinase (Kdo/WaaP) family